MGKDIRTAAAVFMVVSGAAALILSIRGLFPVALLMILFFMLFFAVFAFGAPKRSGIWRKASKRDNAAKEKAAFPPLRRRSGKR